jgi:Mg-chelatase subunit ChlD
MTSSQQTTRDGSASQGVHVHFLLDRSGSMGSIASDVIGGFNEFLREQQARPGACRMTLVQFDSQQPFELLAEARDVGDVPPLDERTYHPRGATPLLDAMGDLLDLAERRLRGRDEDPVVVVFTDGLENASQRWRLSQISERIAGLKRDGWSFVFLGANQDAYQEGGQLGVDARSTSSWSATPHGTRLALSSVSRSLGAFRAKDTLARAAQRDDFFEGVKEAEESTPESPPQRKGPTKH